MVRQLDLRDWTQFQFFYLENLLYQPLMKPKQNLLNLRIILMGWQNYFQQRIINNHYQNQLSHSQSALFILIKAPMLSFARFRPVFFNSKKNKPNHKKSASNPDSQIQKKVKTLPKHYQEAYKIKKEAYQMKVTSQAETNASIIKNVVLQQRQQLNKLQHQNSSQLQKLFIGLTGVNFTGMAFLSFFNVEWLGFFVECCIFPSALASGGSIIGCNLASLIMKQSLNLHQKQLDKKQVDLTNSPLSYYGQMGLSFFQLASLIFFSYLGQIPSNFYIYTFIPIISLIGHSYYQQSRLAKISYAGLPIITTLFALLSGLYMIAMGYFGDKEEFHQGRLKYRRMWRWQKVEVEKEEKINKIINMDDE